MSVDKGTEQPVKKYCPLITAGNYARPGELFNKGSIRCLGKECGVWNESAECCGLISCITVMRDK